jgi:hypothetical protein
MRIIYYVFRTGGDHGEIEVLGHGQAQAILWNPSECEWFVPGTVLPDDDFTQPRMITDAPQYEARRFGHSKTLQNW